MMGSPTNSEVAQEPVPGAAALAPHALVDLVRSDGQGSERWAFVQPRAVLRADVPEQVQGVLAAVQGHAQAGRWCVGGLAYEAAQAFEPTCRLPGHSSERQTPLAWFAVFDEAMPWPSEPWPMAQDWPALHWQDPMDRGTFDRDVAQIHEAIRAGEVYQINHTATWQAAWQGTSPQALGLFEALCRAQPQAYAVYLDMLACERWVQSVSAGSGLAVPQDGSQRHGASPTHVLSVSPELFVDWEGDRLLCRPMKGTAPRGATPEADQAAAVCLRETEKERAENLMIVDLIRNDLSRIARPHTVDVPTLFDVRAWPTVWQMTSDVTAQARAGVTLAQVMAALFPCGSITGAPKWRAMHHIAQLERQPRGFYCGALGLVRPGGHATFNVAIRTVSLWDGVARCGIGSGITLDASAPAEWAEWRSKRLFLHRAAEPFDLLETLRAEPALQGAAPGLHAYPELQAHLDRLAASARALAYRWDDTVLQRTKQALSEALEGASAAQRVRLTLGPWGTVQAQASPMPATPPLVKVAMASAPMDGQHGMFVRHKTTRRAHYDAFLQAHPGVFDVLLHNEQGEFTEFTRGNVAFLMDDGVWVTPPLQAGLLPGVGRARALAEGRVVERSVHQKEWPRVSAVAFMNALRGWVPAEVVNAPTIT